MRAVHGLSELAAVPRRLDVADRASEVGEEEHARCRRSAHDDRMGDMDLLEADDEIAPGERSCHCGSRTMLGEIHSELLCRANRLRKRGCAVAFECPERVHDNRERRRPSAEERSCERASGTIRRADERDPDRVRLVRALVARSHDVAR